MKLVQSDSSPLKGGEGTMLEGGPPGKSKKEECSFEVVVVLHLLRGTGTAPGGRGHVRPGGGLLSRSY